VRITRNTSFPVRLQPASIAIQLPCFLLFYQRKMGRAHSPRKTPSFIKQELAHFSNDQPLVYDEQAVISVMWFDDPRVLHV
jgi:hypothetical protein